jgi:hypothetical protein
VRNCFGRAALDFGHKRLPVPPAKTTGFIIILFINLSVNGHKNITLYQSHKRVRSELNRTAVRARFLLNMYR